MVCCMLPVTRCKLRVASCVLRADESIWQERRGKAVDLSVLRVPEYPISEYISDGH